MNTKFKPCVRDRVDCSKALREACTVAGVFLLLGLTACSSDGTSSAQFDSEGSSTIKMKAPEFLILRALDFSSLQPVVMINNQPVVMNPEAGQWSGTSRVAVDEDATLSVEWIDNSMNELLLARAEKTASNVDRDITLEILDSDYITDGAQFDADMDAISNIAERRQDSDPFDANDPGVQAAPLVKVRASRRTTTIDGIARDGTGFWNLATYSNLAGEDLRVNNLIVDETGTYIDQGPNYQWAAIHDGRFLNILVYGKSLNADRGANGDSNPNLFNDDTLEIFIDGDLSRLDDYDTVDDLHFLIPLVMESDGVLVGNRSDSLDKRIQRGTNVKRSVIFDPFDESLIEFASCLCTGPNERVTWEIRIDMQAANIAEGQTFGFDIQINQDDDGGTRDAKWAWFAPSRQPGQINAESDATWVHPNLMGQIQLLAFPQ